MSSLSWINQCGISSSPLPLINHTTHTRPSTHAHTWNNALQKLYIYLFYIVYVVVLVSSIIVLFSDLIEVNNTLCSHVRTALGAKCTSSKHKQAPNKIFLPLNLIEHFCRVASNFLESRVWRVIPPCPEYKHSPMSSIYPNCLEWPPSQKMQR